MGGLSGEGPAPWQEPKQPALLSLESLGAAVQVEATLVQGACRLLVAQEPLARMRCQPQEVRARAACCTSSAGVPRSRG